MSANLKQEIIGPSEENNSNEIISLSSSSGEFSGFCFNDSGDDDECYVELDKKKKQKIDTVLPVGFLNPLRPEVRLALQKQTVRPLPPLVNCPTNFDGIASRVPLNVISVKENIADSVHKELAVVKEKAVKPLSVIQNCKQFWKAGDYGECVGGGSSQMADMDRVRVHPKFLHSNATSHKWALGAFAELLDNALDEVCNGATYVNIDVQENMKDNSKMLLVEDNGGGMTPDKMRQCMSLGYSAKSKIPNTIGQYGNGFKTSTMRLGADVIVFSRCQGKDGRSTTQSIGMLSYTFLRRTGKEDIVVPIIDYEKIGETWNKLLKSSLECWQRNLETILHWSPYESEEDLLQQFKFLKDQGTRIIIYNIWEDDEGSLELDFDTDPQDIQIRGASRDEKNIKTGKFISKLSAFSYLLPFIKVDRSLF